MESGHVTTTGTVEESTQLDTDDKMEPAEVPGQAGFNKAGSKPQPEI